METTQNKDSKRPVKKRRRIRLGNRQQMSMPVEVDVSVKRPEGVKDGE
jgi:hypothetical protein